MICSFAFLAATVYADNTPEEVHIALAGNDGTGISNGMSISWTTDKATASSTVWYGTTSGDLTEVVTGAQASYWAAYTHKVVLSNLKPASTYYYKCGDNAGGISQEFTFTTAPTSDTFFKMAVLGDMGTKNSEESIAYLKTLVPEVDLYYHIGDVGYADDAVLVLSTFERVWNKYMNAVQDFTAVKPYMTLPGNHEAECHDPSCVFHLSHLSNFTAYNARFRMPSEESGGVESMWYSFNYGPVHFVMMDTETDYPDAPGDAYVGKTGGFGDQMSWLEADLAAAAAPDARATRPWIIVGGHRPIYSINSCENSGSYAPKDDSAKLQTAVEGLLHKYQVDLFLAGHVHAYERHYPVYDSTNIETSYVDPENTVYIVSGNAGNPEANHDAKNPEAPWHAVANSGYGVGTIEIVNRTTLHWTALYSGKGDEPAGTVMDEIYLVKNKYAN